MLRSFKNLTALDYLIYSGFVLLAYALVQPSQLALQASSILIAGICELVVHN